MVYITKIQISSGLGSYTARILHTLQIWKINLTNFLGRYRALRKFGDKFNKFPRALPHPSEIWK